MVGQQTDVENARQQLAEGLARIREQSDYVERLFREGKPLSDAIQLLSAMRQTATELETHLRFLAETEGRQE